MKIPDAVYDEWNELKDQGDLLEIAKTPNLSYPTVVRAFKNRRCSEETFSGIAAYFNAKKERIRSATK